MADEIIAHEADARAGHALDAWCDYSRPIALQKLIDCGADGKEAASVLDALEGAGSDKRYGLAVTENGCSWAVQTG